jgi:hypothetical protein
MSQNPMNGTCFCDIEEGQKAQFSAEIAGHSSFDMEGVTSSILVAPTIETPRET